MLNEREQVFSLCCAEPRLKVTHCVVVEPLPILEQERLPLVFAFDSCLITSAVLATLRRLFATPFGKRVEFLHAPGVEIFWMRRVTMSGSCYLVALCLYCVTFERLRAFWQRARGGAPTATSPQTSSLPCSRRNTPEAGTFAAEKGVPLLSVGERQLTCGSVVIRTKSAFAVFTTGAASAQQRTSDGNSHSSFWFCLASISFG